MADRRLAARALHAPARRRPARDPGLGLAALSTAVRDPGRQRRLEQPEAPRPRRARPTHGGGGPPDDRRHLRRQRHGRSAGVDGRGRCGRTSDRARWDAVTPGRYSSTTTSSSACAPSCDLAPLHQPKSLAALDAAGRAAADGSGSCVLRHGVPRADARWCRHLRPAGRVAHAVQPAPLRLPRPVARLCAPDRAPSSSAVRPRCCAS